MMELIQQGKVNTVIATRWDRLTRNQEFYLQLKQILQESNVRLYLLDQGEVDLTTASGELSADMQAIFAVHERRMLRERILKGHAYRRKRKVAWTRAPWGYVIQNEKYVLDKRPIVCLIENRPENYLELYQEPDDSPQLICITRSDIARESVELLQELKRPRPVLKHLHAQYGIEHKAFVDITEEKQRLTAHGVTSNFKRRKRTNLVLADELLFWSSGTSFSEWVQNPVLRGHTAYCKFQKTGNSKKPEEWEIHHDTHSDQRLLSDKEFFELQLILRSNRRKVGTPGSKFYLTGLVVCDRCGHKMVLKRSLEYAYYGCRHSTTGCSNRKCLRVEKIDEVIIEHLFKRTQQLSQVLDLSNSLTEVSELVNLRQQLEVIEQALAQGTGEALKRARYELLQEIEQWTKQMQLLNLETATAQQIMAHPQARDLGFWHTRTYQEREVLYEKLLNKVLIRDGEVVTVDLRI
jgi:DNA invertase Pin-like site-specific DNA recombinase